MPVEPPIIKHADGCLVSLGLQLGLHRFVYRCERAEQIHIRTKMEGSVHQIHDERSGLCLLMSRPGTFTHLIAELLFLDQRTALSRRAHCGTEAGSICWAR